MPRREFNSHVFMVGAQKAGTTSFHSYLVRHPLITGGDGKELHFFDRDRIYRKDASSYLSLFPALSGATHALDSTPVYMYNGKAAERIHAFRPDAKIIMLLREPVSRAFSAFNMYQQICQQTWFAQELRNATDDGKTFFLPMIEGECAPDIRHFLDRELAIINGQAKGEEPALIRRGIYAPQLERFIRLFGRESVLVLFSDDLKREPERLVNDVLQFIGLEPLSGVQYPPMHVREYTADPSARDEIRRCAGQMFAKDKRELVDMFGLDVPW